MKFRAKFLMLFLAVSPVAAQSSHVTLTMDEAIEIALENSPRSLMAQLSFMSAYWTYRSYKANLLPSLKVSANLGNYNRSLATVTDKKGEISYVANNNLSNSVSLAVNQKIVATGGTLSLSSNLTRLDQFRFDKTNYSGTPISVVYNQPIRGFNSLKWQKELSPRRYEKAKCSYLTAMESIKSAVINQFFSVLTAQNNYRKALDNQEDTKRLYDIAIRRNELGTVTKTELMQMELSMLNAQQSINTSRVAQEVAIFNFKSYLGISNMDIAMLELIPPAIAPNVVLEYEHVLDHAYANSSHMLDQEIDIITAQQGVAQAKASRGLQVDFRANVGYSQSGATIKESYASMRDKEVVGLTLSMPIYDWGMSKGNIKMAQAEEQLAMTEMEQEKKEFEQDIRIKVMQFNNQEAQCIISSKSREIANERYEISKSRFENGTLTVTNLDNALEDKDNAETNYINQLKSFWSAYYELQSLSLYDYINGVDISADFDSLVE